MNRQATGIVAYITFIGWLIAYFAGDRAGAKFHLNQALVVNLASIILGIITQILVAVVGAFSPIMVLPIGIISNLLGLGIFVLAIIGLVGAIQQTEHPIPVLGSIRILN